MWDRRPVPKKRDERLPFYLLTPRPPAPDFPLTAKELLDGYSAGAFVWPGLYGERQWFVPLHRTLLPITGLHVSRSLARTMRSGRYEIRFDTDLRGVMAGCARPDGTWITEELVETYTGLWPTAGVHCAEAWDEHGLAGGVYGLALGGAFFAESMFHRTTPPIGTDAGKIALSALVDRCRAQGFAVFDVQLTTEHLLSLGAYELPLEGFSERLAEAVRRQTAWGVAPTTTPGIPALFAFAERYGLPLYQVAG